MHRDRGAGRIRFAAKDGSAKKAAPRLEFILAPCVSPLTHRVRRRRKEDDSSPGVPGAVERLAADDAQSRAQPPPAAMPWRT
jgi:hypothetical protein